MRALNTAVRRNAILHILCARKQSTVLALAHELQVSPRTIRRDIDAIGEYAPICTQPGRCGGVSMMQGYKQDPRDVDYLPYQVLQSILGRLENDRCTISPAEQEVLQGMLRRMTGVNGRGSLYH